MANMNREIERTKQTTEEKCKKEYMEEMKKLAAKHKDAISATKKKQWVSSQINARIQYPLLRKAMGEFSDKCKDAISTTKKSNGWVLS